MEQFEFKTREKTVLLGGMALGILCLLITFFVDDELGSRTWSNFLHNSVFFTGVGFISLFILAAFITAWAGWHTLIKRIWEAYSLFLIPGMVLMLIVIAGLLGHFHHLYHWADEASVAADPILQGKSSFLNVYWYAIGSIVVLAVWIYFAIRLRRLSLDEDANGGDADFTHHRKMRWVSATFLPIAAFSSAALIWQWLMSIDAHWYSTLYAWYTTASWFVATMALTILNLIYFKHRGYLKDVSAEHLHDLGKYLFAFSIFWTYLWFSQYMLIWYGNVGEETVYFHERQENYPALFYGNLLLNFIVPFFVLMRNDTKRKFGTMAISAIVVLLGHWIDFFLMIKPGVIHTAHEVMAHAHGGDHGAEAASHAAGFALGFTFPGLLELGTFVGFLSLFVYFVFNQMTKANLIADKDPFYVESIHHHV